MRYHVPLRPRGRPERLLAGLLWLASAAAIAIGLATWHVRGYPQHPTGFATGPLGIAGITIAGIVYATVGLWLVSRAPRNLLGWVVLVAGAGLAAVLFLNQYIEAVIHPFRPVPEVAMAMGWVSGAIHLPASAAAAVIAILLFPTGRLEWRPMRAAAVLAAVGCALLVLGTALYPDGQLWYPTLPSPVAVPDALRPVSQGLSLLGICCFIPAFAMTAVCLAWRFRHGTSEEQRPLAWVTAGGTVMAVTLSALFVGRYTGVASDADGERLTFLATLGAVVLPLTLIRYYRASAMVGVQVPDVTFLFTDLADSAAMYRRFGDRPAFDLVRLHFDIIRSVTRANHGVVIKTIGDAIMAAFAQPADAVATAVQMFERIDELNERRGAALELKMGLYRGPAIRVGSPDRADYFGQTVNAAARLEAAAAAGEICLGHEVLTGLGVSELLSGFDVWTGSMELRGVADEVVVHRVRVTAIAPGRTGERRAALAAAAPELDQPAAH